MTILVIETATAACSVALIDEDEVVDWRHELVGRGHAERLLPMIAALAGGGRADEILVDCGPGSFTGIRVGIAAALGLGLGWRAKVRGYGSLALLAATAGGQGAVAIEGGHGELFVAAYPTDVGEIEPPRSLPFDQAVASIGQHRVIGNAAARLVAARGWGEAVKCDPDARSVTRLPPRMTLLDPKPFYGRAADAKPLA